MYIKLGKTAINYSSPELDDFMIVSEVVDSGLSYESPVIVRTVDELDIWFTNDFAERDFLVELLNSGVSLYLYKPISTKDAAVIEGQVDLDSYTLISFLGYDILPPIALDILTTFKVTDNLKLRGKDDNGKYIGVNALDGQSEKFSYYVWTGNLFHKVANNPDGYEELLVGGSVPIFDMTLIGTALAGIKRNDEIKVNAYPSESSADPKMHYWYDGEFVLEENFTQNQVNLSKSLNLRSTLAITNPDNSQVPEYTYPEYMTGYEELGTYSDIGKKYASFTINPDSKYDLTKFEKRYQTFVLNFKNGGLLEWPDGGFFIFPDGLCFYRNDTEAKPRGIDHKYWTEAIDIVTTYLWTLTETPLPDYEEVTELPDPGREWLGRCVKITTEDETDLYYICTVDPYYRLDYMLEKLGEHSWLGGEVRDDGIYEIWKGGESEVETLTITNFTNIEEFEIGPEEVANNSILYNQMKDEKAIEFYSKTIGSVSEFDTGGDIKVTIEKVEDEENVYHISLSRYSYSEEFEGTTKTIYGEERLDYKITRESKLVYCMVFTPDLREGTYILRGGEIETQDRGMWRKALSTMFVDDRVESVCPDFFMVPNIDKYEDTESYTDQPYYGIYKTFLQYAKMSTCQFLIENDDRGSFSNDYLFNYTKDTENYLVWFYRGMTVMDIPRPAYYAFLIGLLRNQYSVSIKYVLYNQPTSDPYVETEKIEADLIKYKSNYLVSNNQVYYYKSYQNGRDYQMTIWMRFTAGKVYRELEKNRYQFIGEKFKGQMQGKMERILERIVNSFSIVQSINLTSFEPDEKKNTLNVSIQTGVNDLVSNNLNLDITLNYTDKSNGSS